MSQAKLTPKTLILPRHDIARQQIMINRIINNVEIHVELQSVIIDRSMIVDSSMMSLALNNGKTPYGLGMRC